jgi:CHAT domain-containing protein
LHNRAKAYARAKDWDAARRDLDAAEAAANALPDPALRERNAADVQIARATLLQSSNPQTAVESATNALRYVTRATPALRLAPLLLLRARSREALGDAEGARDDLMSARDIFESKRAALGSPTDRVQAFEQERFVYKALVRHFLVLRNDPAAALRAAERSRGGMLTRAMERPGDEPASDPIAGQREMPDGVTILYFELLDDRIASWVLSRTGWHSIVRQIDPRAIEVAVARVNRLISDGASLQEIGADGRFLYRTLIDPALPFIAEGETLFIVPDGSLHELPFAVLPDAEGRPLVMTRNVGVAASVSGFLSSTSRLRAFVPSGVLALGDGHDPTASGLPRLLLADEEAAAIGLLYPTKTVLPGAAASIKSMLASTSPVIHFAGHTVLNREFPLWSYLLLAPESGDGGMLLASDIALHRFTNTRVVVLATCEAAAGRAVEGEGLVSVATAFLSAGVPSVVASLWPVSDADARRFFVMFHRELRSSGDAVSALRRAQLQVLGERPNQTPIREWGGFVAMGGFVSSH